MIIDSHCHLDLLEEKGFNIDEIVANAGANDVKILQTICTRISKIDNILRYTKNMTMFMLQLAITTAMLI